MADKQPTGTVKTTTGVKGVDPASETGTPKQSEAPEK